MVCSGWSSVVCSSDLAVDAPALLRDQGRVHKKSQDQSFEFLLTSIGEPQSRNDRDFILMGRVGDLLGDGLCNLRACPHLGCRADRITLRRRGAGRNDLLVNVIHQCPPHSKFDRARASDTALSPRDPQQAAPPQKAHPSGLPFCSFSGAPLPAHPSIPTFSPFGGTDTLMASGPTGSLGPKHNLRPAEAGSHSPFGR